MIFHENRSHEISYLIFFQKKGKISQNLSSAAVMIDALRVKGTPSSSGSKRNFNGLRNLYRQGVRNWSMIHEH